jgi:hypothetical protein
MGYGLAFDPLVPHWALITAAVLAALAALPLLATRAKGAILRSAALALLVLALANPSFTREDRDPLTSVVAVVVDRSPSQNFLDRTAQTEAAKAQVEQRLQRIAGLEVRVVEAGQADSETDGTRLFGALQNALADVPPDRVAGAVMITDGRVHDVPGTAAALGFQAPVHALITGRRDERDRRVVLVQAPRFGLVGQQQTVGFRIEDQGTGRPANVRVIVRRDNDVVNTLNVTTGRQVDVQVDVAHAGANIIEIEADPLEGELTPINNRAVVSIDGVREKLRVLLVSGEPHAGERTWRNLLKGDANVDLVHFTILRPPEKQDGTPINELSLIAFPTRELFQQKIRDFDLIIFDRYARQGILPLIYFDNIARYVRDGGAVLIAAGPDYASQQSLWRTPLESVLSAEPTGRMTETPFHPKLTDIGKRHPVTRGLTGGDQDPPRWSRWFRQVETTSATGSTVMSGAGDQPLLILERQGEGRAALMLSDHIWLWARGYEGGGPHLDLLRRLSHWLMKEPDLDEEALRMLVRGRELTVQRQTMAETAAPVEVTAPSGARRTLTLAQGEPGIWRSSFEVNELGLWRATDGTLDTLINVGPVNPREYMEVTSTADILRPLVQAAGGDVRRLQEGGTLTVPRFVAVRSGDVFSGTDWMGLKMREASVVRGIGILPLFAGLLGLILLIGSLAATWAREGR